MSARFRHGAVAPALLAGAFALGMLYTSLFGDQGRIPLSVMVGFGLVFGALHALAAIGLILVYRSGRVVNFAQAGFGVSTVMLYLLLRSAWGWGFWVAAPVAIMLAAALGWVVEVFVIRRFTRSPRLVLTVVTIALTQTMAGLTLDLPRRFGYEPNPNDPTGGLASLPSFAPPTPFDRWQLRWYPAVFNGNHMVAVALAVVAMVGLALFLRRSRTGVAVRGASENADRAQLLGINVNNLSSVVWILAAVLAASAALLTALVSSESVASAAGQGFAAAGGGLAKAVGATALLRALAAAVIARMDRIPVAVAASFAIAMFEQSVLWATGSANLADVALLLAIVVALLVQRARGARVDEAEVSSWEATDEVRPIPAELARLPQVRAGVRRSLWALALAVVAYPWVMSPSNTNLGGVYAIYAIIGVSLVVLTGWGGQISLGQFGFVAFGAAIGGYMTSEMGLPFLIALVVGAAATGVLAMGVGLPALRIKGLFLAVSTLGFAVAMSTWFLSFDWIPATVNRPVLLWFDSKTDERSYYYVCVAALIFAIFVAQGLRRSRTGRVLIAMRDNERTAQAYGINLVRSRLTAFAISGMLAGFAGVLYAHHQAAVSPSAFGPEQSVQMFLMAVLGGLGSVYAVIVGALYLGTTTILLTSDAGQLLASGMGVLGILLFFPTGLGSLVFRARDAWLRRIALRHRIFVPTLFGDRLKEGEEARIAIAERLPEQGEVERVYRLESNIGEAGASQLEKLWRF